MTAPLRKTLQKFAIGDQHSVQCDDYAGFLDLWKEGKSPRATAVEAYLDAQGCILTRSILEADALRFHPGCRFGHFLAPAMVALLRDVQTEAPRGVHLTALRDDGLGKRVMPEGTSPTRMIGRDFGTAVTFGNACGSMGVTESIETALNASQRFNVPVWAVTSAGRIATLPIIPRTKRLTIFSDHTPAALRAARKCVLRYESAGIDVELRYPTQEGMDCNTCLLKGDKREPQ